MKRRYADGGPLPSAEEAAKTAVLEPAGQPPMTAQERLGKVSIPSEIPPGFVMPRIVPDSKRPAEVGVRKEKKKVEVYEKKLASGGYVKAADGCVKRGKTRGRIV